MKDIWQKNKNVFYGYLITCLVSLVIVILFSGNVCAEGDDALFIDKNGNVGIGKTAPGAALDINGRIKDQTGFLVAVGSIVAYAGAQAPDGWLFCDGAAIPQDAKFNELRNVLERSVTPDLRGRTLIGAGQGPGLSARPLGQQGGEENHKLTIAEMPAHKHYGFGEAYDNWPLGLRGPKSQMGSHGGKDSDNYFYGTTEEGGSAAFNNMQPYTVVNYIIKY